ncbi:sucrose/H+ symporter [Legionella beliardensis]|uniref:Sucrose/H+ symporter n=1 Tax=Legionella beliardensis TaxID=91822 RepID=A0A378HYR4_9GAMM|nr:MFS transporter [Legionella beliardensis]STX27853.1 sucrose/H+ symporter [Legionella beliardensis]
MEKIFRLKYAGLALMAFAVNFCFTFQLSNLTVLLKFVGATDALIPLIWLIPPLTGMLIQPIVGYLSDNSSTIYGKRKPYIIGWGVCAALSFLLLPLSSSIIYVVWFTFLIDCSINGSAEGLRALTADFFQESVTRTRAFSVFAFFSGLGGVCGAYLPNAVEKLLINNNINLSNSYGIPANLVGSYLFTGIMLLATLVYFFKKTKEKPASDKPMTKSLLIFLIKELLAKCKSLKKEISDTNPIFLRVLTINSIAWIGIFTFWLYFSLCLAQQVYHLPKNVLIHNSEHYKTIMHQVSLDVSFYFSLYQYVSLVFTLIVYNLSKYIKSEKLHGIALLLGGLGISLICFKTTPLSLLFSCICIGIFWGSLVVLPYVIVLKYLPSNRNGTYLGIFNISITLPQILGGFILPFIYNFIFKNHANYALFMAGILILISSFLWFFLFHWVNNTYKTNLAKV